MANETSIKEIRNPDDTKCVSIMARDDGYYRFVERSLVTQDGYTFWTPTYWSGIYETEVAAEGDARTVLPWMRAEKSN
jgi:hypothetical protein